MCRSYSVLILAVAIGCFVTACSRDASTSPIKLSPGVYIGSVTNTISDLLPDDILLRVNGKGFTRRDFDLDQEVFAKLMAFIKDGKMNTEANDIKQLKMLRAPKLLNTVLRRELLNQEARKRGIIASDAARAERQADLLKNFSSIEGVSIEKLANMMGDECGRYFLDDLEKDAENLQLTWTVGKDSLSVSQEEILAGSNRLAKANELTVSTNAILRANLERALLRINNGEDFANVGSEVSMFDKDEAKVWGIFTLEDFDTDSYPDVPNFLSSNPCVGTVAGPFDCDDGVCIVKLLAVIEPDADEIEAATNCEDDDEDREIPSVKYKLARISVETFDKHPELSLNDIREILEDDKRKKFEAIFGKQLFESAVIEFPSGTNLFSFAQSPVQSDEIENVDDRKKTKTTHKGNGGENVN